MEQTKIPITIAVRQKDRDNFKRVHGTDLSDEEAVNVARFLWADYCLDLERKAVALGQGDGDR